MEIEDGYHYQQNPFCLKTPLKDQNPSSFAGIQFVGGQVRRAKCRSFGTKLNASSVSLMQIQFMANASR